ncbi:large ribosomal RNA subunit accumulation protein YCED homolog 1, chloroplastic [Prosopis cineraria]|uniref:large ribosomal RNA subunit accumulation protein YCED homolog 1, chloroplastic n=1 Tax=Prosopis cineraria TaxID=364024 RepID=UPI0024100794|nr:large ribosomal RNA subunit accumulation protein YCED homolog 1, chloroplastic [Prosopis cineraria]
MSLVFPSSSTAAWHFTRCKIYNLDFHKKSSYISYTPFQHRTVLRCTTENILPNIRNVPNILRKYAFRCKGAHNESFTEERTISLDLDDEEDFEDTGSPWEGAVIYKRNSLISHLEYCTTLERLGLGSLSTDVSKSRASVMGLRVTKAVKDYPHGTPVQISIDVTRKKKKLRLDGIIKTVISLGCNRCGQPAAEGIFSEFCLLLTDEPIAEPETIDLGVIYGKDIYNNDEDDNNQDDDNDALIDLDDRLHFPPEEKEIDISKHIRDRVHLEITINAICDPRCKGLCLKCGTNLNTSSCNCSREEIREKSFGPLGNLKEQLQR